MKYEMVSIYDYQCGDQVVYWPVMARPGRQRRTRCAFVKYGDAMDYGCELAFRYSRYIASIPTGPSPMEKIAPIPFVIFDDYKNYLSWMASSMGVRFVETRRK
jgi:hypothetical protein